MSNPYEQKAREIAINYGHGAENEWTKALAFAIAAALSEGRHARFAPSSADRWSICQASTLPYSGPSCRGNDDNEYANKGTACHKAAVECITRRIDPMELIFEEAQFGGLEFTIEMAELITPYVNAIREKINEGWDFYLEQWVDAPSIHEHCSGTADAILWKDNEILVVDLKTGSPFNEVIQPDTKQLAIYAIGALELLGIETEARVSTIIVQPLDVDEPVKVKVYSVAELKKVAQKLRKATQGKAVVAGTHCKYCPHAAVCETLNAYSEDAIAEAPNLLNEDNVRPDELSGVRIAEILDRQEVVKLWWKACAAYANELITMKIDVPGWELKDGLSDRYYIDPFDAEKQLHLRYDDDIYEPIERKLRSPAAIEKIWPNAKPLMKMLTTRSSTGVKLKRKKVEDD